MKINEDIERTKILKMKANEGKKGMGIIAERARDNV